MRAVVLLLLATAASAQIAVGGDVSLGPSLTTVGASGTVEAGGIPLPVGTVEFPTSVGLDARVRLEVRGATWGGRVGVGYLGASDVFDGASLVRQQGIDLAFVVASGEVTYRQPYGPGVLVVGAGPEVRALLDEGSEQTGLLRFLGDVRRSHLAVGVSAALHIEAGGWVLAPEVRGGYSLTPFSDDRLEVLGGTVRLGGDFRFHHGSVGLTVATR